MSLTAAEYMGSLFYHFLDLTDGGQDGGVVPVAVLRADLLERKIGERADEVH